MPCFLSNISQAPLSLPHPPGTGAPEGLQECRPPYCLAGCVPQLSLFEEEELAVAHGFTNSCLTC